MKNTVTINDVIQHTFDFIENHTVIKDSKGDIIEDAVIDYSGSKSLQEFYNEILNNKRVSTKDEFVYTFRYEIVSDGIYISTRQGTTHKTLKGAYKASQKARNQAYLDWVSFRQTYGKESSYNSSSFIQQPMEFRKIKVEE